ncbi:MAG: hypothetical protein ACU0CI_15250, partial [Shimia sp.]
LAFICAIAGSSLTAQEAPTLAQILNPDALISRALQSLVISARTVAEVEFDAITSRGAGQRISITGLEVWMLPAIADPDCYFGAERVQITTSGWDAIDRLSLHINGIGAIVTPACLGEDARPILEQMDLEEIPLDQVTLTLDYHVPSAGLDVIMTAGAQDLARIEAQVDFDYFSIEAPDGEDPLPAMYLNTARIAVDDFGLWAKAKPLLPAEATTPLIAPMIAQGLTGAIVATGESTLNETETAFVTDLTQTAAAFLADGGTVIATLSPEQAEFIPPEWFDGDFVVREAIEIFRPAIGQDALRQAAILTPADWDALSPSARILAALGGEGIPRNVQLAIETFAAASGDGDTITPEASIALADELAATEPEGAYALARSMASLARPEAATILDRIEADMTFAEILALQGEPAGSLPPRASALQEQALGALTGHTAPRSYAAAYRLALLAQAAGDLGAQAILDEIETSFGSSDAWPAFVAAQARSAHQIWTSGFADALAGDR